MSLTSLSPCLSRNEDVTNFNGVRVLCWVKVWARNLTRHPTVYAISMDFSFPFLLHVVRKEGMAWNG